MKSYFDDPEEPEMDDSRPLFDTFDMASEAIVFSAGTLRSKDDLINLLPDKQVADKLVMRYFGQHSPSLRESSRCLKF
jgi:hypothetical protein